LGEVESNGRAPAEAKARAGEAVRTSLEACRRRAIAAEQAKRWSEAAAAWTGVAAIRPAEKSAVTYATADKDRARAGSRLMSMRLAGENAETMSVVAVGEWSLGVRWVGSAPKARGEAILRVMMIPPDEELREIGSTTIDFRPSTKAQLSSDFTGKRNPHGQWQLVLQASGGSWRNWVLEMHGEVYWAKDAYSGRR
jgi:hypothetical protein